jgi:hypothetical protein
MSLTIAIESPVVSTGNGHPEAELYSAMVYVSSNGTIYNLPNMIGDKGYECYIRRV